MSNIRVLLFYVATAWFHYGLADLNMVEFESRAYNISQINLSAYADIELVSR